MVSEIQPRQTFSGRQPAHPTAHLDTMGENNTPTALKGCGVKSVSIGVKIFWIEALYILYCTLFVPYINYYSEMWGNTNVSNLMPICILQKKIVQIINKVVF